MLAQVDKPKAQCRQDHAGRQRRTAFLAPLILLALFTLSFQAPTGAAPAFGSTAEHVKFEQLKVKFNTGQEVTRACLECHSMAARQIHKSKHWTWEYKNPDTGQLLGKKNRC